MRDLHGLNPRVNVTLLSTQERVVNLSHDVDPLQATRQNRLGRHRQLDAATSISFPQDAFA
jgi:hypothetical protein